ncbi:MAG: type II secretion system protein GspD [Gammaproteobacteria bacterium]|nr:type II secretion system protein GspD [Gammaproteobacteria bacterium]
MVFIVTAEEMWRKKCRSIATRNSKRIRRNSMLALGAIIFHSCAILNPSQDPVVPSSSSAQSVSGGIIAPNGSGIPVIPGTANTEQQALIDAINREGESFQYRGFSEQIPQPEIIEGDDIVELNYEQADLRIILEELANALDIAIVLDPSIDNRISIRTPPDRPLQRDDIWPLIRLLTRDAGILVEQIGDVFNARKLESPLPAEIVTADSLSDTGGAEVMQVTPLTFVSSEAVIQAIEPFLSPDGSVSQLGNRDLLIITGSEYQLNRINQLLMLLDADPFANQGIHLYQLSNANAAEVATELAEILLLIEGPTPSYQVRGIERINSILVTAPAARGFEEISRWVRILDADIQEQVEQLFMYRVKNLDALELADTLSNVFEDNEDRPFAEEGEEPSGGSMFDGLAGEAGQAASIDTEIASQALTALPSNAAVSADLALQIVADEATNSLLIRSTARDYRQLLTTISQLDVVPLQVMVNAVIAQITLTDDTRFGVDWSRIANDAVLDPISTSGVTDFAPNLGGLMFSKGFIDGSARVEATLEAIAQNNEVRLLARPSLTVGNNQEGEIQIGAEVPVEAGESISAGGLSTTNIQYRDTGIGLLIEPKINEDGVVNLIITQTLRSVDNSASGINNNPVFNNQEITTTVVVRDGENIVLGGLIQTDTEQLNTGIPLLNRIPAVGNLFSYQQDNTERRELFIVLRPEIINLNEEEGPQYAEILDRFALASELFEKSNI